MTNRILLALLFAVIGPPMSRADDWIRADLYFIDWDVSTRYPLTPRDVRKFATHRQTFTREAPAVRRLLALQKLNRKRDNRQKDARVVVDYVDDDARRHTIYLSQFELCTADNQAGYLIDEKLRRRISLLARKRQFR